MMSVIENNFWVKWGLELGQVSLAPAHKNGKNQLKPKSGQKFFPPAALRAALFTKKHIRSLHLLGAGPIDKRCG